MRIDKFLKNARLIKRRTVAKEACQTGRILINNKVAKPGSQVEVGDKITLKFNQREEKVEVLDTPEHVKKDQAQNLYKII